MNSKALHDIDFPAQRLHGSSMRHALDRNQIVDAAVRLMAEGGPTAVSFRAVARELGCAHTNLYNYFTDADSLIHACGEQVLRRMSDASRSGLPSAHDEHYLEAFYRNALLFYLEHPGWFQLIWSYPGTRPTPESREQMAQLVDGLVQVMQGSLARPRSHADAHNLLHTVHAYLHGELSIFFAGRSLFATPDDLERYVVNRCVQLTQLLASN